jgi:hypothetical protein
MACALCGDLADRITADLEEGERLPETVSKLQSIAASQVRRCPTCRAWFLYEYDYEYGAMGDGWETATLERVDRVRVLEVLMASPPSPEVGAVLEELGVANGELALETKLIADLDDAAASYEAVRKPTRCTCCRRTEVH